MKSNRYGRTLALKEHMLSSKPVTNLDALLLFGVLSLTRVISAMRKEGWVIHSKGVPYATAVTRVNQHTVFKPPRNLLIREIILTEYWVSR